MTIPWPKILSVITIPSGGLILKFRVSTSAGGYETQVTVTLAAGDYFMSWDGQASDFLYELTSKMQAGIVALGGGWATNVGVFAELTSEHKVKLSFDGARFTGANAGVKMEWTQSNGPTIAAYLGFDGSADDANAAANPTFTGDWQHMNGWYADEDGLMESLDVENENIVDTIQSVSISGKVNTQKIAQRYASKMALRWLPQDKTFSRAVGYGTAPVYPYSYNKGLECFWVYACQGKRFRVYRQHRLDLTIAADCGEATSSNTTTVTNTNKAYATAPMRFDDCILYMVDMGASLTIPQCFFIASHTATVITIPLAHPSGYNLAANDSTYYIFDNTYDTYVLDLREMKSFLPREIGSLNRFDIDLPLLKYVA